MWDVTHATNMGARPLAVSASIDANMETFTPVLAFLPSECHHSSACFSAFRISVGAPLAVGLCHGSLLGQENIHRIQLEFYLMVIQRFTSRLTVGRKICTLPQCMDFAVIIVSFLQKLGLLGKGKAEVKK